MFDQVVHELQMQVYGAEGVVPMVVPFNEVEKQVFGEVQAVP